MGFGTDFFQTTLPFGLMFFAWPKLTPVNNSVLDYDKQFRTILNDTVVAGPFAGGFDFIEADNVLVGSQKDADELVDIPIAIAWRTSFSV